MITKLQLLLLGAGAWLSVQGCMFVHDTACVVDSDCDSGRTCNAGQCADTGEGRAGESESESGSESGSESESDGDSPSSSASEGPSCTALRSGTQQASHSDTSICQAPTSSFSVSIGSSGLVQSIGGQSCALTQPGYSCYETFPDEYECGACTFKVHGVSSTGIGPAVGWNVSVEACIEGCTKYCCSSDSGFLHASDYWLEQSGSGGGTAGGGSSGGNPRDPCNGCGPPFCDGNCAGCC